MKPPIPIVKPCTADWTQMTGDDRQRLCAQCDKHVHNLSALTPGELRKFVENRNGSECIAYVYREDGSIETAPRWPRLFQLFQRVRMGALWALAALLPSLFGGCASGRPSCPGPLSKGVPMPGGIARPPATQQAHTDEKGNILLGR